MHPRVGVPLPVLDSSWPIFLPLCAFVLSYFGILDAVLPPYSFSLARDDPIKPQDKFSFVSREINKSQR